jgi:predicted nucleic acid-binding protein
MIRILADAGPLYAFCNRQDFHHSWAKTTAASLRPPLFTCEPVLTEVFWRIQKHGGTVDLLWEWITERVLVVDFNACDHWADLERLMSRYAGQPMDFADACMVRMTEIARDCRVWTTDSDFKIYRRNERLQIPLIFPD